MTEINYKILRKDTRGKQSTINAQHKQVILEEINEEIN